MRPIVAVLLIAFAPAVAAQEMDWSGTWTKEGGGSVAVKRDGDRFTLEAGVPANGAERAVSFAGPGRGEELALVGSLATTRGVVRALGGAKPEGSVKPCRLDAKARAEGDEEVADVTYSVDGAPVRRETWRRRFTLVEITDLRVDGAKLAGEFDPKLATKGMEVRYVLRGSKALPLEARVLVDPEKEKYPRFYGGERVRVISLGSVSPGPHSFTWDGRDGTDAARLVVEGGYEMQVYVDPKHDARAKFSAAAPRYAFMGWRWGSDDTIPAPKTYEGELRGSMAGHGYATATYLRPTDRADVLRRLEKAAFVVLSSHGGPGELYVYDGDESLPRDDARATPIRTFDLQGVDLRDLHVAIVSGCEAAKPKGSDPGVVQALCDRGCDLALGFSTQVVVDQAIAFQKLTLALLERGAPIEKAARDAGRVSFRELHAGARDLSDEEIDRLVAAQRAGNDTIKSAAAALEVKRPRNSRAQDETFWPPRYGNSKN